MNFQQHYKLNELPEFIVLIGIPGSGKSTWIAKYNKNNKYIVVSPDNIRLEITGSINDQSQNKQVWAIAKEQVTKALEKGQNVMLDATMTDSSARKSFIKDLPQAQLKAKIFYIDPEVSKTRIKQDIESGKERANVPNDVIDRMQNDLMKSIQITDNGNIDATEIEKEGFKIIK